ncbi:hypothetical protein L208DRAFT_1218576, partial [Tricholoma matsutake]
FDMKQKTEEDLTDNEHELLDLTGNIEEEENTTVMENNTGDKDTADEDDMDGWVNKMDHLTAAKKQDLEESIKPLTTSLLIWLIIRHQQLRKLSFKIIHSTTILLPIWKQCIEDLRLPIHTISTLISQLWHA